MIGVKQALIAGFGISAVAGGGYGTYYLLSDKTIEDKLNREGFDFIKVDEGYQVAFKELRKNNDFINTIKTDANQIKENSSFADGGLALSKWCNAKIKEALGIENIDSLIKKVKDYCKGRPLTIASKLNKKLFTGDWSDRLNSLKSPSTKADAELLQDLKTVAQIDNLDVSADNKVVNALSKWCQDNYSKKLIEDTEENIYPKVDRRCTQ